MEATEVSNSPRRFIAPHYLQQNNIRESWNPFSTSDEINDVNSEDENQAYSSSDSNSPGSDQDAQHSLLSPSVSSKRKTPRRGRGEVDTSKRNRVNYSDKQQKMLSDIFEETRYPSSFYLDQLSSSMDVPRRKLKVWFQNARARLRKRGNTGKPLVIPTASNGKHQKQIKSSKKEIIKPEVLPTKPYKKKLEFEGPLEGGTNPDIQKTAYVVPPTFQQAAADELFHNIKYAYPYSTSEPMTHQDMYTPPILPTMRQLLFDENDFSGVTQAGFTSPDHSLATDAAQDTEPITSPTPNETSSLLASSLALLTQNCESYSMYGYY